MGGRILGLGGIGTRNIIDHRLASVRVIYGYSTVIYQAPSYLDNMLDKLLTKRLSDDITAYKIPHLPCALFVRVR